MTAAPETEQTGAGPTRVPPLRFQKYDRSASGGKAAAFRTPEPVQTVFFVIKWSKRPGKTTPQRPAGPVKKPLSDCALPGPSLPAQAKGVPRRARHGHKIPSAELGRCLLGARGLRLFDHFRNIVHPEVKMHLVLLLSGLLWPGGAKIVRFLRKQGSHTGGAADSRPAEQPEPLPALQPARRMSGAFVHRGNPP